MRKYFMNLGINRKTAPQLGFIVPKAPLGGELSPQATEG